MRFGAYPPDFCHSGLLNSMAIEFLMSGKIRLLFQAHDKWHVPKCMGVKLLASVRWVF